MRRHRGFLALMLVVVLLNGCIWPFPEMTAQPATATTHSPGRTVTIDTTYLSPLATPGTGGAESPTEPEPTPVVSQRHGGLFSGRSMRFDLPEGYRVLEGLDGGCFLYHESLPGFLVLYPEAGEPGEMLTELLNTTAALRRTEPPLEVDLGGLTFLGLFVETDPGSRLFLAAADGWVLVAQGPMNDWSMLATSLNQVLMSLSFKEGF